MIKFTIGFLDSYGRIADMGKFIEFEHRIEREFKSKKLKNFGFPFSAPAAIHFEIVAKEFYFDVNEGSTSYGFRSPMADQTFPGYIRIGNRIDAVSPNTLHMNDYIIHMEEVESIFLDSKEISLDDFIENPNVKNNILNFDIAKKQVEDNFVHIQFRNKNAWIKIHEDDRFDKLYDYKKFLDKDPRYC